MGLFSRKPDRGLQAELAKQANGARVYYEQYPKYRPLYEMVDSLAKTCCTGAAQTVGPDLPPEVVKTWPHFSQIFEEAKQSLTWLWPDV